MADKSLKVKENLTKDEEIKLIQDFYEALPQDSYLKELLQGIPEYCEAQVTNDWTINPLDTINEHSKTISELQQEVASLNGELETKKGIITKYSQSTAQQAEVISQLRETTVCTQADYKELLTTNKQLQQQVTELKAKLYDFMVRE